MAFFLGCNVVEYIWMFISLLIRFFPNTKYFVISRGNLKFAFELAAYQVKCNYKIICNGIHKHSYDYIIRSFEEILFWITELLFSMTSVVLLKRNWSMSRRPFWRQGTSLEWAVKSLHNMWICIRNYSQIASIACRICGNQNTLPAIACKQ